MDSPFGQKSERKFETKNGRIVMTCRCGYQGEITPDLKKCPGCSADITVDLRFYKFMGFASYSSPVSVKYSLKEISEWLQTVRETENTHWNAEKTENILVAALEQEETEIRLQGFLVVKMMPITRQLRARVKWKVIEAVEAPSLAFKLVALEIMQKWPNKQKGHSRIQERARQLQADDNSEVRRLAGELLKTPSKISRLIEELKEVLTLKQLMWSVGMILLFLFILLNFSTWMQRGDMISLILSLVGSLMFVTWLLAVNYWIGERYPPQK